MRSKDEMRSGIAQMLRDLRIRKTLSKSKIADIVGVDDHTWASWESGRTSPSVVDFVHIYNVLGENMMHPVMQFMFDNQCDTSEDMRKSAAEFLSESAPEHTVQALHYILFGHHGSSPISQIEQFCALDHLPLEQRYYIAELIYVMYKMSENRGDLIESHSTLPDMRTWESALKAGQKAAFRRLQSYSAAGEHDG